MTITREALEKRKQSLMADMNAIGGALQDCDYWLKQLDYEEKGIPIEDLMPGAVVEEVVAREDMTDEEPSE